jgi:uncharacterized protein
MLPTKQPGSNKHRSRRQRKKLHIAEFQQIGFEYSAVWSQFPTVAQQDAFIDGFLDQVIVARGLELGGGFTKGAIVGRVQNPTDSDREAVCNWLKGFPGIVDVQVGPLVDAWYQD